MADTNPWLAETLALIIAAQQQQARMEKRVAREQDQIEALRAKVATLTAAMEAYAKDKRLPMPAIPSVDMRQQQEAAPQVTVPAYQGMAPRDLLFAWADAHAGRVVMNDVVQAAVAAGNYKSNRLAAGGLYATMSRLVTAGDFVKPDNTRGVFCRKVDEPHEPTDNNNGTREWWAEPNDEQAGQVVRANGVADDLPDVEDLPFPARDNSDLEDLPF